MPLNVVFDTNIWIAGLNWRGVAYRCLLLARTGVVQLVFCSPMAAELSEKLREKFGFSENDIRAVMYEYRKIGRQVVISGDLHVVDADSDDDKFIECAVVGNVAVIVSEDRHLINLAAYDTIRIVTAQEFLAYVAALPAE
jgi:putative PIN family toxin of toxin-antitoxin system